MNWKENLFHGFMAMAAVGGLLFVFDVVWKFPSSIKELIDYKTALILVLMNVVAGLLFYIALSRIETKTAGGVMGK